MRAALVAEFGTEYADADPVIRPSPFADFQSNVALALAKRARPAAPGDRRRRGRTAGRLAGDGPVAAAEISGPGFINITLARLWVGQAATGQLADPRLGVAVASAPSGS